MYTAKTKAIKLSIVKIKIKKFVRNKLSPSRRKYFHFEALFLIPIYPINIKLIIKKMHIRL